MTHWRLASEKPRSACAEGRATFTTVASSRIMIWAMTRTPRAVQRRSWWGLGEAVKRAPTASGAAEAPAAPEGSIVLIFFTPRAGKSERQDEAPLRLLTPT